MKLFTCKSITVFLVLILLATVFTFFQNKNVVKFDNGKTVIVDKYNNNAEVKIEKGSILGDILDLIVKIMGYIADFIDSVFGGGGSKPNPDPDPSPVVKNYIQYNYKNEIYYVVKNYNDEDYKKVGSQAPGKCTWYARAYAQRIRKGSNKDPKNEGGPSGYGLSQDRSFQVTDKNGICNTNGMYKKIKSKILDGFPVVIYVGYKASDKYKNNHNLTIIGVKKDDVDGNKDLGTGSFLAIDPYDANLCNMLWDGRDCGFLTKDSFSVKDNQGQNTNSIDSNYKCLIEY